VVYGIFERARLYTATKNQIDRFVNQLAAKVSPGFDVESYKLSDYKNLDEKAVWIEIKGRDRNYGTVTSHLLLAKFPAPDYSRLVNLVAMKKRKYPYVVGYKMEKVSQVELQLPKGYELYFLPENFSYKNRVGSLSVRWNEEGNKLKMTMKMVLNKSVVPVNEYQDLRELFNTTVKTLRNQIVVLKKE